ncbi:Glycosyltransferase family 1 [Halomicronema hongdechloris C2206]|uniref:Glycosyltransferase family 1 n=1 Tax=Halomicronema hongdechloris C2206 TaxID=1641165 RepID=A0A1Z3HJ67_9CYAN|nr:glycosyltransferase family 4 protein [Halomicronema hongdechloris]ASC70341.1 Glycosyltransferase family 1 [Halomicronema hongdechloris C2206]
MHLIVLENEPSTRRGGQELSLFDVCQALVKRGHTLTLLYRQPGNLLAAYQDICQQMLSVEHYRLDMKRPLASGRQLLQDLRRIAIEPNSLIYCNQYHDSFFAWLLARLRRRPLVCHVRLPPPPNLGWQWSLGMRGAHRQIAVSQYTKSEWVAIGYNATRIDVVHNGIDIQRFTAAATLDDAYALRSQLISPAFNTSEYYLISYVGRLDRGKGIETLLHGFALAQQQYPQLHLAIAGKPHNDPSSYLQELKRLATNWRIDDSVTFLGHVDDPSQVYRASDLVVVPSEWPEPFGRTIIEAMACGVPVVASRVGGIPEILTKEFQQRLVSPGNAAQLAAAISDNLTWRITDPDLAQRCRQHIVAHFSLSRTIDGIEQAFARTHAT